MSDQIFNDPTEDIEGEFDALIEELRMEIGSQNAEKRRKSRAKTIADKKSGHSKDAETKKKEEKTQAEESTNAVPSMLKRIIAEEATQDGNTKESKASQRSMLYEMTNPTSGDKTVESE